VIFLKALVMGKAFKRVSTSGSEYCLALVPQVEVKLNKAG
jgi:hypothetical protein